MPKARVELIAKHHSQRDRNLYHVFGASAPAEQFATVLPRWRPHHFAWPRSAVATGVSNPNPTRHFESDDLASSLARAKASARSDAPGEAIPDFAL